jgi:Tfp pilus assembly protein PilX
MRPRTLTRFGLRGEEGIALVLAVLVLAIVTIVASSAIMYTLSSQQDAASKKSGVTAYSLAQAALSNATAQLTSHYYDSTGQPHDNTTSLTYMAQNWAPSGSQISPSDATACSPTAVTTCMTWSGELRCPVTVSCSSTSITVSDIERAQWHITATGRVPNPSGPGVLMRTITVDVPVNAPPAKAPAPDIFKAVYTGKVSTGCDLTTGQGVVWASPVYVVGNLCFGQNSGVEAGSAGLGKLVVGGWMDLTQGNGAHVGTSTTPVPSLSVAHSCDGTRSATPCTLQPNGAGYKDAANTIFVSAYSNAPVFPDPPSVDWAQRQAERGNDWQCTSGHSLTAASFNLTGTPYVCTTNAGSLSWDGTTLNVTGNVYIDGNLTTNSNAEFVYTGLGSIYVGGSASFGNNTSICVGSTANHDCPSGSNWMNIADNFLLILVKGGITGGQSNSNFSLEGGLYSDSVINFGAGHTNIYGPIVTPDQIFPGQQAAQGFPNIIDLFTGAPGTPQPYYTLGAPENGTY